MVGISHSHIGNCVLFLLTGSSSHMLEPISCLKCQIACQHCC
jgi:hypothetical protein